MRGGAREELFRAIESHRANHWTKVPPNPELDWKITEAVQKALASKEQERTRTPAQAKPLFRLDLRKDWDGIFDYIKQQVRLFLQSDGLKMGQGQRMPLLRDHLAPHDPNEVSKRIRVG